jgi:putative ATP-dependent endonuclease of OLD family
VTLTDGDKGTGNDEADEEPKESEVAVAAEPEEPLIPGQQRKTALEALATTLGASAELAVIASTYSLETELLEAGNDLIMSKAYLTLHPRYQKKWDKAAGLSGDERAKMIHSLFKETRKGDFAQVLARLIEDGEEFKVPNYIAQAIAEVVAS